MKEVEAEVPEAVKRSFDPRTDNMLNIPDEQEAINESMRLFKPPADPLPNNSQLSIESRLPETARRGMRGGVPLDQMLMSEDSIEEWRNFTPGYVSPSDTTK